MNVCFSFLPAPPRPPTQRSMATGCNELGVDDVINIARELLDVQNKSETLGRLLKVPKHKVEAVCVQYSGPQDQLFHIIEEFVKQVEPSPTWKVIVDALRNPLMGEPRLAQRIEKTYCPLSPAATAGSPPCELVPISVSPQSTSLLTSPSCRFYDISKLKENIKTRESLFYKLRETVLSLLEIKSIAVDQIVYNLTLLPASEMSQHEPYFQENLEKLEKCTKCRPLFSRLNLHWNYLSPQLLFHLVREFLPNTVAIEEMKRYNETLKQFRYHTLLKLFCQIEEEDIEQPDGFSKIVAKFEISDTTTLQDVENFRLRLARHYRLRDFALMLKPKVMRGSFIVSFLVPNSVLKRLKLNIPQRDIFDKFGITQMDLDGHCVFRTDASRTDSADESIKTGKVVEIFASGVPEIAAPFHSFAATGILRG